MTMARDHLSKSDTLTIAAIETGVPLLVEARDLTDRFQAMIRTKATSDFEAWVLAASRSMIASFASGIIRDRAAVRAAALQHGGGGSARARGGAGCAYQG